MKRYAHPEVLVDPQWLTREAHSGDCVLELTERSIAA